MGVSRNAMITHRLEKEWELVESPIDKGWEGKTCSKIKKEQCWYKSQEGEK